MYLCAYVSVCIISNLKSSSRSCTKPWSTLLARGRQYNEAQALFLASSRPITALEMRRDLLQWEAALRLARSLAPAQVPLICRQFAQQLEFQGEHAQATQVPPGLRVVGGEISERQFRHELKATAGQCNSAFHHCYRNASDISCQTIR